jgi:hypothetical protein
MIYGLLKAKSSAELISVLLFLAEPSAIIFLNMKNATYFISEFTKTTYSVSGFLSMNKIMARVFGNIDFVSFNLLSPLVVKIQIFIAFAYTYHYQNWFSKTSIIGWKKSLTSTILKYIIVLWICAIGLYL